MISSPSGLLLVECVLRLTTTQIRERLQHGLAPGNMKSLLRQRMRWVGVAPSHNLTSGRECLVTETQTDAGIEVCQRLGYFIPAYSSIASRMTRGQRAVNMLYVLRDFSPLGITLAMLGLPLAVALFPQDQCTRIAHEYAGSLSVLRTLSVASWASRMINTWLLYRHVGLGRVANFQSQEVWTAPCML